MSQTEVLVFWSFFKKNSISANALMNGFYCIKTYGLCCRVSTRNLRQPERMFLLLLLWLLLLLFFGFWVFILRYFFAVAFIDNAVLNTCAVLVSTIFCISASFCLAEIFSSCFAVPFFTNSTAPTTWNY